LLVNNPELTAIRDTDLVVDLSGDMLTEDYGPHVAYSHFLPILTALAMGRPVMLCAQSIGPFKLTRGLARFILNRVSLITVREAISFNYLPGPSLHGVRVRPAHTL
jgi:polysaccharide pyruvyl transferase WcaK-like protein